VGMKQCLYSFPAFFRHRVSKNKENHHCHPDYHGSYCHRNPTVLCHEQIIFNPGAKGIFIEDWSTFTGETENFFLLSIPAKLQSMAPALRSMASKD
jgi:hypothetical protein